MARILVIDNDAVLCRTLQERITQAGHKVSTTGDGLTGLRIAHVTRPDLIILDLKLPRLDGLSICRRIRSESANPIIILTTCRTERDRVAGFEHGADDYVLKPFSMPELLARIRARLRSVAAENSAGERRVIAEGALHIDLNSRRALRHAQELDLSHKEFDLLVCLMRQCGTALPRDVLIEQVWGKDFAGSPRTLDVHIRWLREKIETDPSQPVMIQTIRGVGYRFDAPLLAS